MKNYVSFVLSLAFIVCASNSCTKSSSENSEAPCYTGIVPYNYYRFWTTIPMYRTTITVTKKINGDKLVDEMMGYYPDLGIIPDPCTVDESTEAVFGLVPGLSYDYVARNGDKVWRGTIKVPCELNRCFNIRIE